MCDHGASDTEFRGHSCTNGADFEQSKFGGTVDGFVPALIVPEMAGPAISAKPVPGPGRMEVFSTNGRRVIADRDVDVEVLLRIVWGLENLR